MKRRQTRLEEAKVDLTPMLDVVFILLIFFIVTAVFLQEETIALEAPPPAPREHAPPVPSIIVSIDEEGFVRVNGREALISSVRANIERLRAETPQSAVIIQAHPEALNAAIIRVRDQIESANVKRVNLVLSDV